MNKDCYSEKGQYMKVKDVRRQMIEDGKKKEDVMSEDKKYNIQVTQSPERKTYVL